MIYFIFVAGCALSFYLGIRFGIIWSITATKKIFDRLPPMYAEAYLKEANKMMDEGGSA